MARDDALQGAGRHGRGLLNRRYGGGNADVTVPHRAPCPPSRYHWAMTRSTVWRLVPALGPYTDRVMGHALLLDRRTRRQHARGARHFGSDALRALFAGALLISALTAPFVGRAIDRHGGRAVMSAGSVAAALALFLIAHVHSTIALFLAWSVVAGVAMAMTMYDAAFATLCRSIRAPAIARR